MTKLGAIEGFDEFIVKRHYKLMPTGWQRTFHGDWELVVILIASVIDADDYFLAAFYRETGRRITVFHELPNQVQASLLRQAEAYVLNRNRYN
jgi:hypothetical protein